ncbi:MAG: c-type cytochrome biogenesis protein CcmI [Pseudomonadota bacterium]
MTTFLIAAVLMTMTALLFVLPGLLRGVQREAGGSAHDEVNLAVLRDQLRELDVDRAGGLINAPAYETARHELEQRVAEDVVPAERHAAAPRQRKLALALGLALPALAAGLYFYLGTPAAFDPVAKADTEQGHAITEEQIVNMVGKLAERLKNQPDDAEGWSMLARSYNALGRFPEAVEAYARLVKLIPPNADVLADYADALAMVRNKSLQGEPEQLVVRALAADPNHVKALSLAGSAAFERRDYPVAVGHWQKILTLVPPDSETAQSTKGSIAEASGLMGAGAAPVAQQAAPAATVSGTVDIDPAIRARLAPGDSVFIFARAQQGPRFPLAVLRKQVRDLPLRFTLDDSMSMVPNAKLSNFPMVVVGARVSKSGSATPQPGDFEGLADAVRPGAEGLKILINVQRN